MTEQTKRQVLENLRRIDWLASAIRTNTPTPVLLVPHSQAEQISVKVLQTIAIIEHNEPPTKGEQA